MECVFDRTGSVLKPMRRDCLGLVSYDAQTRKLDVLRQDTSARMAQRRVIDSWWEIPLFEKSA